MKIKFCVVLSNIVLVLFMRFSSYVSMMPFLFHTWNLDGPFRFSYLSVFWFFFLELSINKILCRLENVDQTDVKYLDIYYGRAVRWFVFVRNVLCVHTVRLACNRLCMQNARYNLLHGFISFSLCFCFFSSAFKHPPNGFDVRF